MSTYEDKLAAASRWPRQDAPLLDVTGMGLARRQGAAAFNQSAAEQMVGRMLANNADPDCVGKVLGVRGFRDGHETFYGLKVMWTKNVPGLGTNHTTVFREELADLVTPLSGNAADAAERKWASNAVLNNLAPAKQTDRGMGM